MNAQPTYTLTHEQIQAIAQRAAELAIEQVLDGMVPKVRPVAPRIDGDGSTHQLTAFERDIVSSIFRK